MTMPKLSSKVWNYFVNKLDNPKVTICQVSITNPLTSNNEKCNKEMAYSMGSTSAMSRHLKTLHNIHIDETSAQSSTNKQTNEQFYQKQSINSAREALARCVSIDEMSVNTILNSEILKDYLDKVHHFQMPKTGVKFEEIIVEYYNQVVENYKQLFEYYKIKNGIFSIILDGFFSMRSYSWAEKKSWTVLTVHCNVDTKIELFELAYFVRKLRVEDVLRMFGLDLHSDIVGCNHNSKLCMLSNKVINQFCVKSTINTTIRSIIFKNDIYQWTKTLSGFFLHSKNSEILQKYVVVGKEKEFEIISDRKDDWITTKDMMERFHLLQPFIKQAFDSDKLMFTKVKYKKEKLYYDEHKFCELKSMVECLKLLEKAIGELDESNSNLFTVDETIKNVFIDLGKIDSDFGKQLVHKLNEEYSKVRNHNIVSLMYFLEHRKYPIDSFECFEYSTKAEIIQTANDLNQRLFCKKNLNKSFDEDLTSQFELTETSATLTLPLKRLNKALLNIRPVVTFKGEFNWWKVKFRHSKIIEELLFLQAFFLNKVEILRNKQAIPKSKLFSQVWHYFILNPDNPKVTICQITSNNAKCNKSMSYRSSSTSAMARHLKLKHNIIINQLDNKRKFSFLTMKNSQSRTSNDSCKTLGEILSRCRVDGISISTITNSEVIKDYVNKVRSLKMPNSENEIKELIVQFYYQAVDEYRNMFEHFKSKGIRFSVEIDANYFDLGYLSVHCNVDSKIDTFYLARTSSHNEIDNALRIFGLDLMSDIILFTCDYNHDHSFNGVIKQFCMKRSIDQAVKNSKYYVDIYEWARNLNYFFQSSKHNSNVLQKYVALGDGPKIEFIEYRHDWISIVRIAEQLLELQPYIKEAFESGKLKFRKNHYWKPYYHEHKFGELKNLIDCLKPLEEAIAELNKPNSNLLTADVVMKYVFAKLRQIDSDLSIELIFHLIVKFKEIRNQNIVSLMYFLKHRKYPIEGYESFSYSFKAEIVETANKLNHRLFPNMNSKQIPFTNSANSSNSPTLIDFLNSEMRDTTQDVHLDGDLATHFDSAEKTKTLTPQLEILYNALMSIRPSVTEIDTELTDWSDYQIKKERELYNKLIFLKQYFIRKDTKQINQLKRPLEQ